MIKRDGLWTPQGYHGELTVPAGADVEQVIKRAVRKIPGAQRYEDIQYCILNREDGTTLVYFEILD